MRKLSVDELLGGAPPKKKTKFEGPEPDEDVEYTLDLREIHRGVSVTWLMQAFRMDRQTVRRKLADLIPLRKERGNFEIYDFVQAASYLVKPRVDIREYMKTMKSSELPPDLQKDFWDAQMKRQKYERQAGLLWHTNDVIEVFGEAFKHIKTSVQLFLSNLERSKELTQDQRTALEKMSDGMLEELHQRLTDMKNNARTASALERGEDDEDEDV